MQEIVKKINEKLTESGWYDQLRIFLDSSDFSDILVELKRKVDQDKQRFCPALNKAFRFMEEAPHDKLKAVILIDYACNRLDQADGVALSSPNPNFYDRTPTYIFKSIDEGRHDVNEWLKQGVLIAPLSLTSRIDGRSHKKLWEPFIMRIIEAVNRKHPHIPWVLIGSDTWKYTDDIVSPHTRQFELKNPIDDRQWHQWVNNVLKRQGKAPISF